MPEILPHLAAFSAVHEIIEFCRSEKQVVIEGQLAESFAVNVKRGPYLTKHGPRVARLFNLH